MIYEVGKYYNVPTVESRDDIVGIDYLFCWPIIGPWHHDKEYIHVNDEHYHIDWRFVPERIFLLFLPTPHGKIISDHNHMEPSVIMRRRKCRRLLPVFPVMRQPLRRQWQGIAITKKDDIAAEIPPTIMFEELHKAFEGKSLGQHMQCPHKGAPLESIAPINGVIVCPLHGLCFDAETKCAISPAQAR